MNIIEQAESDLSFTLEDNINGFGVALTFFNSLGDPVVIICQTTDISFFVDPDTGAGVSSRTGEVTARLSTLRSSDIPEPTKNTKINYITTLGISYTTKVAETFYDRKMGVVQMKLESLKNV